MSTCIVSFHVKLELIAMNKLGKDWFHGTFLGKLHGCYVRVSSIAQELMAHLEDDLYF